MAAPAPGTNVLRAYSDEYEAVDTTNSTFSIMGRITSDGRLVFSIRTKVYSGGVVTKASSVTPEAFFDAMMEHFRDEGTPIVRIKGEWSNSPGHDSNLIQFNKNLANKQAKEDAASNTPTGRLAARWKYTKVDVRRTDPPQNANNYSFVIVYFEMP